MARCKSIGTAILDRRITPAVMRNIRGNSYRLKEKLKAALVRSFDDESEPQPGGKFDLPNWGKFDSL